LDERRGLELQKRAALCTLEVQTGVGIPVWWAECVVTTQEIMDMGIYSMLPEYASIFLPDRRRQQRGYILILPFDGDKQKRMLSVSFL